MGKTLWTDAGDGELVGLYDAFNEQDEARFIAERIGSWFGQGERYSDAAILYRSNAQSRELEDALLRVNIPYRIYGGLRFYERLEVRNALAYLRLLTNRHDDAALERVINVPTRGIGDRTLDSIRQLARRDQSSLWAACVRCVNEEVLSPRATAAVLRFLQLLDALQGESAKRDLPEQVKFVIESSGLIEHHEKEGGEIAQNRLENLEELVNAAGSFAAQAELQNVGENNNEQNLLSEFLDQAALDAGDAQAGEDSDSVQLMTLHSAKGLEFPLVFLAGMEEGLFPHRMSMADPNGLEEERRLCYVGITRAKSKLYLTYAESRRLHGQVSCAWRPGLSAKSPGIWWRTCACAPRSVNLAGRAICRGGPGPRRLPSREACLSASVLPQQIRRRRRAAKRRQWRKRSRTGKFRFSRKQMAGPVPRQTDTHRVLSRGKPYETPFPVVPDRFIAVAWRLRRTGRAGRNVCRAGPGTGRL